MKTITDHQSNTFTYDYLTNAPRMIEKCTTPVSVTTNTYEPNRNHLDKKQNHLTPALGGTNISTFDYTVNAIGQRTNLSTTDPTTSPATTHTYFLYDGYNAIAQYTRPDASAVATLDRTHTWGTDLSLTSQGAGGVGGLLATHISGSPTVSSYYPQYDGNGNITDYFSSTGTLAAHYQYDAFGQTLATHGPQSQTLHYRFSTKPLTHLGTYYYNYRQYTPLHGRWLSRDRINELGGENLYSLLGNRTIFLQDFLGLFGAGMIRHPSTVDISGALTAADRNRRVAHQLNHKTVDWQNTLEGLIAEFTFVEEGISVSGDVGFSISVPPGVLSVGLIFEGIYFKCCSREGEMRTGLDLSGTLLSVRGGVGFGLGIKRYPEPPGRNRNDRDQRTGEKLKKLAGQPLPWFQQFGGGGGIGVDITSIADGATNCPESTWGGSITLGVYGEIGALLKAEARALYEWEFGTPFNFDNMDAKIEAHLGFSLDVTAQAGVEGTAALRRTWMLD